MARALNVGNQTVRLTFALAKSSSPNGGICRCPTSTGARYSQALAIDIEPGPTVGHDAQPGLVELHDRRVARAGSRLAGPGTGIAGRRLAHLGHQVLPASRRAPAQVPVGQALGDGHGAAAGRAADRLRRSFGDLLPVVPPP